MKAIIVIILLISVVLSTKLREKDVRVEYDTFRQLYKKTYTSSEEEKYRISVFLDNYKIIMDHNKNETSSYKLGVNQFADLTKKEFLALLKPLPKVISKRWVLNDFDNLKANDEVDWSAKGAVSPIKDQGACGSCYSFAVVSSIESAYFIKNSEMKLFSEQQIVDCAHPYGCEGCHGCWMVDAFRYCVDHGLCLGSDYPYRATENTCKDSQCTLAVKISGYVEVPPHEVDLAKAATITPTTIALDASPMQLYKSGIYDGKCDPTNLNHAVLVTGYGIENSIKFWKIKNSWGGAWGEKGFYRIIKDDGSTTGRCGLALKGSYPTL